MKTLLATFLIMFSTSVFAIIPDSELVIPRGDGQAEQDAIQTELNKRAEVSDADAQKRKRAVADKSHTTLIPYFGGKEPPRLKKKMRNGTYIYKVKPSPQHYSGGVRAGPF